MAQGMQTVGSRGSCPGVWTWSCLSVDLKAPFLLGLWEPTFLTAGPGLPCADRAFPPDTPQGEAGLQVS